MLDVCLVVEGTYPYVAGGVSAWINDLIEGLSTLRFGVVYIGPTSDGPREPRYRLHDNVDRFVEVYINDRALPDERPPASAPAWMRALGAGAGARGEAYRILERAYTSLPQRLAAGDLVGLEAAL